MVQRVRLRAVEVLSGTRVRLELTNGERREIDLGPFLRGPVFEEIRTQAERFREATVDAELGTIVWPNGADIDPDVLVENLAPAWQEAQEPASS